MRTWNACPSQQPGQSTTCGTSLCLVARPDVVVRGGGERMHRAGRMSTRTAIQYFCFGVLSPSHTISGCACSMLLTMASSTSGVSGHLRSSGRTSALCRRGPLRERAVAQGSCPARCAGEQDREGRYIVQSINEALAFTGAFGADDCRTHIGGFGQQSATSKRLTGRREIWLERVSCPAEQSRGKTGDCNEGKSHIAWAFLGIES
jgi:hypothetical protein